MTQTRWQTPIGLAAATALALLSCTQNFDEFYTGLPSSGGTTTTTTTTTSSSGGGSGGIGNGGGPVGGGGVAGEGGTASGGGGGSAFDPSHVAGLSLWLDAAIDVSQDGAGVVGWQDQSGNSNHAVQSQGTRKPTLVDNAIGGKDAIEFDGNNDQLIVADSDELDPGDDSYLLMVVARWLNGPTEAGCVAGKTNGSVGHITGNWRMMRAGISFNLQIRHGGNMEVFTPLSTGILPQGTPFVAAWGVDATSNELIYVAGAASVLRVAMAIPGPLQSVHQANDMDLMIGTDNQGAVGSNMQLAELLFYKSAAGVSDSDIKHLVDHFGTKYGL